MPRWLNRDEYPFIPHYLELPMGRMHYVDEGQGDHAVVLVHGNPVWSFTYRKLIRCLSPHYRCIAMDHIGFGLSDKPVDWDYLPQGHAQNLAALLDHLQLTSITLVVNDWGGPIGMAYAIDHPQKIRSLVIGNSWMWSVRGIFHYEAFSRVMGGPVGRWLIRRYHFFVRVLMRNMFRARLDHALHRHYVEPLNTPAKRKGCWVFPRQILAASDWLAGLWARRGAIADKPAMIFWGLRDIAFRDIELARWKTLFPNAMDRQYADAGHFVFEDKGEEICPLLIAHLHEVTQKSD